MVEVDNAKDAISIADAWDQTHKVAASYEKLLELREARKLADSDREQFLAQIGDERDDSSWKFAVDVLDVAIEGLNAQVAQAMEALEQEHGMFPATVMKGRLRLKDIEVGLLRT